MSGWQVTVVVGLLLVLVGMNGYVLWRDWKVEVEKQALTVSHPPVTLQLMDGSQRLRHEITLHCAAPPKTYRYGGAEYTKLVSLKSGVHVYGPA